MWSTCRCLVDTPFRFSSDKVISFVILDKGITIKNGGLPVFSFYYFYFCLCLVFVLSCLVLSLSCLVFVLSS